MFKADSSKVCFTRGQHVWPAKGLEEETGCPRLTYVSTVEKYVSSFNLGVASIRISTCAKQIIVEIKCGNSYVTDKP